DGAGGDSGGSTAGAGEHAAARRDPPPTEPGAGWDSLDLRQQGDERTLAEWLTDEKLEGQPGRTDRAGAGGAGGLPAARDARRAAEQAISENAVPRRYHRLIRRYFDRIGGDE
ncbi:MAG: hypothetical protein KJZ68_14475, partial [Phycisphaerales bacterium]|nr:hypothetical protein [Phycisphaerales bacterium]